MPEVLPRRKAKRCAPRREYAQRDRKQRLWTMVMVQFAGITGPPISPTHGALDRGAAVGVDFSHQVGADASMPLTPTPDPQAEGRPRPWAIGNSTIPNSPADRPDRAVRHPCERMLLREHTTDRKED